MGGAGAALMPGVVIKVGTCGFTRARSRHYKELDAAEVQQTFYDPRSPGLFERWRSEAPDWFEFTVKVWMLVTHGYSARLWRRLRSPVPWDKGRFKPFSLDKAVLWALEETLKAARVLGASLLVFQTPPSFRATEENSRTVVEFFRNAGLEEYRLVWEPRGSWWERPDLLRTTASRAGLLVGGDVLRGRIPPEGQGLLYTRLHGLGGRGEVNYRYKYKPEDLERLKGIVEGYGAGESYVMFNNIHSFEDAVIFKRILAAGQP